MFVAALILILIIGASLYLYISYRFSSRGATPSRPWIPPSELWSWFIEGGYLTITYSGSEVIRFPMEKVLSPEFLSYIYKPLIQTSIAA